MSGTAAEVDSLDYQSLKEQLARAKESHIACRFIYLVGHTLYVLENVLIGETELIEGLNSQERDDLLTHCTPIFSRLRTEYSIVSQDRLRRIRRPTD